MDAAIRVPQKWYSGGPSWLVRGEFTWLGGARLVGRRGQSRPCFARCPRGETDPFSEHRRLRRENWDSPPCEAVLLIWINGRSCPVRYSNGHEALRRGRSGNSRFTTLERSSHGHSRTSQSGHSHVRCEHGASCWSAGYFAKDQVPPIPDKVVSGGQHADRPRRPSSAARTCTSATA